MAGTEVPVTLKVEMTLLDVLVKQCLKDSKDWFPGTANASSGQAGDIQRALIHHSLSLCGEAGELANLIKKVDRGQFDVTSIMFQNDAREELVDVFIYVLNLAGLLGMDLLKEYLKKRDKNSARFGKAHTNGAV